MDEEKYVCYLCPHPNYEKIRLKYNKRYDLLSCAFMLFLTTQQAVELNGLEEFLEQLFRRMDKGESLVDFFNGEVSGIELSTKDIKKSIEEGKKRAEEQIRLMAEYTKEFKGLEERELQEKKEKIKEENILSEIGKDKLRVFGETKEGIRMVEPTADFLMKSFSIHKRDKGFIQGRQSLINRMIETTEPKEQQYYEERGKKYYKMYKNSLSTYPFAEDKDLTPSFQYMKQSIVQPDTLVTNVFCSVVLVAYRKEPNGTKMYYGSHNTKRQCFELPAERKALYDGSIEDVISRLFCKELNICDTFGLIFKLTLFRNEADHLCIAEVDLDDVISLTRNGSMVYDKNIDMWAECNFSNLSEWSQKHLVLLDRSKTCKIPCFHKQKNMVQKLKDAIEKWKEPITLMHMCDTSIMVPSRYKKLLDHMASKRPGLVFGSLC